MSSPTPSSQTRREGERDGERVKLANTVEAMTSLMSTSLYNAEDQDDHLPAVGQRLISLWAAPFTLFVTNPCPRKHYKTTRAAFNVVLEHLKELITSILSNMQIPASERLRQVALELVGFQKVFSLPHA
jgi:hypothetical protein